MKTRILTLAAMAVIMLMSSCSGGKGGYTAKDFYNSDDPEVKHMLSRASHREFKIKDVQGTLYLGGVGGPKVSGKSYANSSESVEEDQYAFIYYNEEKDKYYLIQVTDGETYASLEEWCEENLK